MTIALLFQMEAAEEIASQLSKAPNVMYLPDGQQMLLSLPAWAVCDAKEGGGSREMLRTWKYVVL